ncbi:MAM and LDL-receptor class A domain-containing protein 1-like [Mytilus californianus]|uniref:MAM and LDL-receptor class A domain-containing protein 1-like n=1 Tax=Mytilus californianus TaxID=6549 RepID=UPI0022460B3F|nr:MAM and LDL-receptor class A domain-containing protein 1-like [Mytilus californianus]
MSTYRVPHGEGILKTPEINLTSVCVEFWYSMPGSTSGIKVEIETSWGHVETIWSNKGKINAGKWSTQALVINCYDKYKILFSANKKTSMSYVGIDDIHIYGKSEVPTSSSVSTYAVVPMSTTATTIITSNLETSNTGQTEIKKASKQTTVQQTHFSTTSTHTEINTPSTSYSTPSKHVTKKKPTTDKKKTTLNKHDSKTTDQSTTPYIIQVTNKRLTTKKNKATKSDANNSEYIMIHSSNLQVTGNNILSFWYHMNGNGIGSLTVYLVSKGTRQRLWQKTGRQSPDWLLATIPIRNGSYQIELEATAKYHYGSDLAVDDITLRKALPSLQRTTSPSSPTTVKIAALPINCNFEGGLCGFKTDNSNFSSASWIRKSGTESLGNFTFLRGDNTTGSGSYLSLTIANKRALIADRASLYIPAIRSQKMTCLTFAYSLPSNTSGVIQIFQTGTNTVTTSSSVSTTAFVTKPTTHIAMMTSRFKILNTDHTTEPGTEISTKHSVQQTHMSTKWNFTNQSSASTEHSISPSKSFTISSKIVTKKKPTVEFKKTSQFKFDIKYTNQRTTSNIKQITKNTLSTKKTEATKADASKSKHISKGAQAGIGVTVSVVGVGLVLILLFLMKKKVKTIGIIDKTNEKDVQKSNNDKQPVLLKMEVLPKSSVGHSDNMH